MITSSSELPTSLSLFSGAGGIDIGVRNAGFNILACIEQDPFCCRTLRANIERERLSTLVIEDDIRNIEIQSLMIDLGLEPGELDLLFGGPPCQAFSQIGKRQSILDERGMLLFEMVRFAKALQPKMILIEQVKGLLNAQDHHGIIGGVFRMIVQDLQKLGYTVKWKTMSSADYGVPQIRQRVFIVAVKGIDSFDFPEPTHSSVRDNRSFFDLPAYRTVGDVIDDLPIPASRHEHSVENSHIDITPVGDRRRIHGVPEGDHLAAQLHLPAEQRQKLTKKDTTKFRRMDRRQPALTLRCGEIFFHPTEDRYLTVREYMRIHTYPDNYILEGPIRGRSGQVKNLDQYRQVANSVPPLLSQQICASILECLHQERVVKTGKR